MPFVAILPFPFSNLQQPAAEQPPTTHRRSCSSSLQPPLCSFFPAPHPCSSFFATGARHDIIPPPGHDPPSPSGARRWGGCGGHGGDKQEKENGWRRIHAPTRPAPRAVARPWPGGACSGSDASKAGLGRALGRRIHGSVEATRALQLSRRQHARVSSMAMRRGGELRDRPKLDTHASSRVRWRAVRPARGLTRRRQVVGG
jgi:hypothetical protein